MLQIVQNGEKCKKPENGDFQPKITKCAPFWAQKWGFSSRSAIFWKMSYVFNVSIMSRHLVCFLLYVVSCCIFGQSNNHCAIMAKLLQYDT